jgi:hypothetical protein
MCRDVARGREPDVAFIPGHVIENAPELAQPEGLSDDEGMDRKAVNERLVA